MNTNNIIENIAQRACKAAYATLENELSKLNMNEFRGVSTQDFEGSMRDLMDEWVVLSNLSSDVKKSLYRGIKYGLCNIEEFNSLRDEARGLHDKMIKHQYPFMQDFRESLDQFEQLATEIGPLLITD